MGASNSQIGFGMALAWATTANGTFTSAIELIEIKPYGVKVGKSTATHHQSPGRAEEYKRALTDYSEVEATVAWSKTEYAALNGITQQDLFFKITYPDGSSPSSGSTEVFPGFVSEIQPATPLKERMTTSIKIQPQGVSTFTAGT